MLKKVIYSIIAISLSVLCFSACQSKVNGTYLGRDIDECYEEWGFTPGKDAVILSESGKAWVMLPKPVNYLGDEFIIWLTYPVAPKNPPDTKLDMYYNKLDSVAYRMDFYKTSDEVVAEKSAAIFAALKKEYGTLGEVYITKIWHDTSSSTYGDESVFTKERILEEMAIASKEGKSLSLKCELSLPDKLKELDQDFITALEDRNDFERTYAIRANLEYNEGRYLLSITHTFGRLVKDGLR